MNSKPPLICGALLTAMIAAGISHYWSIESLVANYPITAGNAIQLSPTIAKTDKPKSPRISTTPVDTKIVDKSPANKSPVEKEFFDSLLVELRKLQNENRDLRDLMGETNRDVMKLAFRVDTHSESFRPLPTSEERDDTSFNILDEELPGVLPPRALPIYPEGN